VDRARGGGGEGMGWRHVGAKTLRSKGQRLDVYRPTATGMSPAMHGKHSRAAPHSRFQYSLVLDLQIDIFDGEIFFNNANRKRQKCYTVTHDVFACMESTGLYNYINTCGFKLWS